MQQSPQITVFEQSMRVNMDDQTELSDPEPEIAVQEPATQNLLLSKQSSFHNNIIVEDENEEGYWEESGKNQPSKPFLMSISFPSQSLYRFPTLEQEKDLRAEINNIEAINNVIYYQIETKSSQLGYQVRVKRRYNDFKFLLRELSVRYPYLIMPYLPIGIGYGKLSYKDVEERKRLLQNVINILTMHQELILSSSVRNVFVKIMKFFEEMDQSEFENKRKQGQINIKGGLAQNLQTVIDKSIKSIGQLKNWWNGTYQKCDQLELVAQELKALQVEQQKYQKLLLHLQNMQRKQQKIKDILTIQDSQKNQLLLETKLHDCVLDYTKLLDFQTNSLEDKLDQYYQQQIWQIMNVIEFIDYAHIYYKQLVYWVDDLNEQLTKVAPNQQTHQTIKDEINKYINKAKDQFCNKKDGVVFKYMWVQQQSYSDYYFNQQQEIWTYAADRKLNQIE